MAAGSSDKIEDSEAEKRPVKRPLSWDEVRKYKRGKFFVCPECSKIYQSDKALKAHFLSGKKCNVKVNCKVDHQHKHIYQQFKEYDDALKYIKMQELDAHFYRRSVHQQNIYFEVRQKEKHN